MIDYESLMIDLKVRAERVVVACSHLGKGACVGCVERALYATRMSDAQRLTSFAISCMAAFSKEVIESIRKAQPDDL